MKRKNPNISEAILDVAKKKIRKTTIQMENSFVDQGKYPHKTNIDVRKPLSFE